jgi:hypothetical protein
MKPEPFYTISSGAGGLKPLPLAPHYLAARWSGREASQRWNQELTGDESDAELRAMAVRFVDTCPSDCAQTHCPFRLLGNLYHASSRALINSLSRSGLVSLFETSVEPEECAQRSPEVANLAIESAVDA